MVNKTKIKAKVVADSLSPQGDRLTSLLITFPRIILAEVNTHRMLSKNTSSSRAIPFNKMVEAIENDPFIPIAFQKHHSGMQGNDYLQGEELQEAIDRWNDAKNYAIEAAKDLYNTGTTKQLCNRLLEPFMWTTMLITGSKEGWDNFFELRCPQYEEGAQFAGGPHYFKSKKEFTEVFSKGENFNDLDWLNINVGQAEIHMMALAEAIYDAMNESTPEQLEAGMWHIPFKDEITKGGKFTRFMMGYTINRQLHTYPDGTGEVDMKKVKISTAMAARTSYTTVGDEKEVDYEKMINLHDRLISQNPPHSSPMEHCAKAMSDEEYFCYHKGIVEGEFDYHTEIGSFFRILEEPKFMEDKRNGWCRNFKGFIQYRHIVENDIITRSK